VARLYFDSLRTALVDDDDRWFDFSALPDVATAKKWCTANGVDFFDHRVELHPEWLRRPLLRARAAARGRLMRVRRWAHQAQGASAAGTLDFPYPAPRRATPFVFPPS